MRYLWIAVGFISLALGTAGAVLPLLPTTPFVLLSAFCFARSSPRFHSWLINHRTFGPIIQDWNRDGAISYRAKLLATLAFALTLMLSVLFRVDMTILLIQVAVFVPSMTFIWTRPTATRPTSCDMPEPSSVSLDR